MPIYTRTGDSGTTSLFGGKRVLKSEERVEVYGSIDELNSWVGYISSYISAKSSRLLLRNIQNDLFTIGSTLAGWKGSLQALEGRVKKMEKEIDMMDASLPSITNFILPGGSPLGAQIHIVRAVCRRVERQLVSLSQHQHVDPVIIKYINRLSDLFFVLARFINKDANVTEITWSGITRPNKK